MVPFEGAGLRVFKKNPSKLKATAGVESLLPMIALLEGFRARVKLW